jgi:hypothetical protein
VRKCLLKVKTSQAGWINLKSGSSAHLGSTLYYVIAVNGIGAALAIVLNDLTLFGVLIMRSVGD